MTKDLVMIRFLICSLLLSSLQSFAQYKRKGELLHLEGGDPKKKWSETYPDHEQNIRLLFEYLERSDAGRDLLIAARAKASEYKKNLIDIIKPSIGSITDTTLIRRFSENNPNEVQFTIKSEVHINRELNLVDGVLDLAHELTHFVHRAPFNPYSSNFTVSQFVSSTIEGSGGEVDAYITECKVLYDLFPDYEKGRLKCDYIKTSEGTYSKVKGAELFYKLGDFFPKMKRVLGYYKIDIKKFRFVSTERPDFISSAYNEPYPFAALKEYVNVMRKACNNDERRVGLYGSMIGRLPAAEESSQTQIKTYKKVHADYIKRCSNPALFQANDALY